MIGRRISAPESAHRVADRGVSSLAAAGILISAVNRIVGGLLGVIREDRGQVPRIAPLSNRTLAPQTCKFWGFSVRLKQDG